MYILPLKSFTRRAYKQNIYPSMLVMDCIYTVEAEILVEDLIFVGSIYQRN